MNQQHNYVPSSIEKKSGETIAETVMESLRDLGFTHCFYVAGGNSMFLLEAAARTFTMIPFVHEVSAGIASEHFNLMKSRSRSFVLVTTGPGLTNLVTAVASAWIESRELVILCGAVKSSDSKLGLGVRQHGIQELGADEVFANFAKKVIRVTSDFDRPTADALFRLAETPRKGPVVLEVPIDFQLSQPNEVGKEINGLSSPPTEHSSESLFEFEEIFNALRSATRPVIIIGGGVDRDFFKVNIVRFESIGVPVFCSWNASDYLGPWSKIYSGRPDNFGQRSANILLNQADFILAVGTRLSRQLTGFNWQAFAPRARIARIDIDRAELSRGQPDATWVVQSDSTLFFGTMLDYLAEWCGPGAWLSFCQKVRASLAGWADTGEENRFRFSPQNVLRILQEIAPADSVFVPSSSGTAEIAAMQSLEVGAEQRLIVSKGLASMGYAIPAAIGAAIATDQSRVFCIEGDGSASQSLSELMTIAGRGLKITIIVLENNGYASIRSTQSRFLGEVALGTSPESGLFLPDLYQLAKASGIRSARVTNLQEFQAEVERDLTSTGPSIIVVELAVDYPACPRVSSDLHDDGRLESRPTWDMSPKLPDLLANEVIRYL